MGAPSPADTRFGRHARLGKPADYRRVFALPLRSADNFFTVLARSNGDGQGRLGLAIARKWAKRAIDRSRLKRIVRESFRHRRSELFGLDCVVLCRRDAVTSPNDRLYASLSEHWRRIRERLCASS